MLFAKKMGPANISLPVGISPTLRPIEILQIYPQLDTIVQFEGEFTLLELLEHLNDILPCGCSGSASTDNEITSTKAVKI